MAGVTLKTNYRCAATREQFFTGRSLAVASDGSFIACACDGTVKIVDPSNGAVKGTLEGDSDTITALALSPDDKLLFSADHSKQIKVWDLSTLKCLRSWKGHEGPVMAMACDASGGYLATAGADRKVLVWDVDDKFCTHYFKGHKGVVTSIMFHPDPNRLMLFSGSEDATVRVWDLQSKKSIAVLEKHFSTVTSLAVSEDGSTLLSAGRDKVVNLWDLNDHRCKITVPTYEVLEAVCVVQSGTSFASCIGSHELLHPKKRSGSSGISFVTVGERGIVRIYNSEGAVCLFEQKSSDVVASSDNDSGRGFTAAFLLPSDQGLLCATADHQILYYSPIVESEEGMEVILSRRLVGDIGPISEMKFVGDEEKFIAVATAHEQVQVYDSTSMSCSYVLAGHTDVVLCLDTCTSSSGETLIVTGSKDKSVRLWDTEQRICKGVGIGHLEDVTAVAFSKKQRNFFVSGSRDGGLKVWSLDKIPNDIQRTHTLESSTTVKAHDKEITSLAVAPNDSLICTASRDRTAHIWRRSNLVSEFVLIGHKRPICSVEFSPVDQCVMTASADKTIKIWAIADGSCLKTFEGHTSSVLRASFLTRGAQLVSCGADGLIKLWTVKTSECIATYDQHEDQIWALAVGTKTEMLATGSSDAVVNLWNDSTACDKQDAFHKGEEEVLKGQELENAVLDADYTKAIQIALELRRPHKLYELFSELCGKGEVNDQIGRALSVLGQEELRLLLEYVREWNTKPKLCYVAQYVLFRVFKYFPPTKISEVKGLSEILEGLIPYSQRHYNRIDGLFRNTFLLNYILSRMSVLEPEGDTVGDAYNKDIQNVEIIAEASRKQRKDKSRRDGEKALQDSAEIRLDDEAQASITENANENSRQTSEELEEALTSHREGVVEKTHTRSHKVRRQKEVKEDSNVDNALVKVAEGGHEQTSDKVLEEAPSGQRKRKLRRSCKDGAHKKVKGAACADDSIPSLQA